MTPLGNACTSYCLPSVSERRLHLEKRSDLRERIPVHHFGLHGICVVGPLCYALVIGRSVIECRRTGFYGGFPVAREQATTQRDSTCQPGCQCKLCLLRAAPPASLPSEWTAAVSCSSAPKQRQRNRSLASTLPTPRKPNFTITISKKFSVEKSVKLSDRAP